MNNEFAVVDHKERPSPLAACSTRDRTLFACYSLLAVGGVALGSYFMMLPNHGSGLGQLVKVILTALFAWPLFTLGLGGLIGLGTSRQRHGVLIGGLAGALPWLAIFSLNLL